MGTIRLMIRRDVGPTAAAVFEGLRERRATPSEYAQFLAQHRSEIFPDISPDVIFDDRYTLRFAAKYPIPPTPPSTAYMLRAQVLTTNGRLSLDRAKVEGLVTSYHADSVVVPVKPSVASSAGGSSIADVASLLGVKDLAQRGMDGHGVDVKILDALFGSSAHSDMCTRDIQIAATSSKPDYLPLPTGGPLSTPLLSDILSVLNELLLAQPTPPTPLVVVNAWEVIPDGSSSDYETDPNHPVNAVISGLVKAGADVIFSAGDPSESGQFQLGGANSHPDVICVAACDMTRSPVADSRCGPGILAPQKPDLSGYSNFASPQGTPDQGTSAACAVVGGVVAAIRSKLGPDKVTPQALRDALTNSAHDIGTPGYDYHSGAGVVDASAALAKLSSAAVTARRRRATRGRRATT